MNEKTAVNLDRNGNTQQANNQQKRNKSCKEISARPRVTHPPIR
jgi:hypothetical protein